MTLGLLVVAIIGLATGAQKAALKFYGVLVFVAAPFLAISTLLVLRYMPSTLFPRLYGAQSIVIASACLIVLKDVEHTRKPLRMAYLAIIILFLGFLVSGNRVFFEQERTNHGDAVMASRIIPILQPNIAELRSIVSVRMSGIPRDARKSIRICF